MNDRDQSSGGRGHLVKSQRSEGRRSGEDAEPFVNGESLMVSGGNQSSPVTYRPPLAACPSPLAPTKGFTLVEVMMATAISVAVFMTMGLLLTRSFTLWMEATANWRVAQHARVTRARLLDGGYGVGTGILSSSNLNVSTSGGWRVVNYDPIGTNGTWQTWGWPSSSIFQDMWLCQPTNDWAWATTVSEWGVGSTPTVKADQFSAARTNRLLNINYTLHFSAMGKDFAQPQTIQTFLVNQ